MTEKRMGKRNKRSKVVTTNGTNWMLNVGPTKTKLYFLLVFEFW